MFGNIGIVLGIDPRPVLGNTQKSALTKWGIRRRLNRHPCRFIVGSLVKHKRWIASRVVIVQGLTNRLAFGGHSEKQILPFARILGIVIALELAFNIDTEPIGMYANQGSNTVLDSFNGIVCEKFEGRSVPRLEIENGLGNLLGHYFM